MRPRVFSASALLAAVSTLQSATPPPGGAADVRPAGGTCPGRRAVRTGHAGPESAGPPGLAGQRWVRDLGRRCRGHAGGRRAHAGRGPCLRVRRQAGGWRQTAELRGSDTQPGDFFGGAVAIAGGTIVVGSDDHDDAGRGYVFTRDRRGWHQTAELGQRHTRQRVRLLRSCRGGHDRGRRTDAGPGYWYGLRVHPGPPGLAPGCRAARRNAPVGGNFGFSVAASGPVAVVGAPGDVGGAGRAYVFRPASGGWHQTSELAGRDTQAGDNFGFSVAGSDGQILVGAPWHRAGAAYVFSTASGGWRQTAEVTGRGTQPGDEFGFDAALGPELAVVGAPGHNAGRAYLFSQAGSGWSQIAELGAPAAPRQLLRHCLGIVQDCRSNRCQRVPGRYWRSLGDQPLMRRVCRSVAGPM